jgi:hypothetical protein
MGRRKKQIFFSYTDIISSSYIRKTEYERAQLTYANNLSSKKEIESGIKDWIEINLDSEEELEGD